MVCTVTQIILLDSEEANTCSSEHTPSLYNDGKGIKYILKFYSLNPTTVPRRKNARPVPDINDSFYCHEDADFETFLEALFGKTGRQDLNSQ
jgi:hypothetical protein